MKRTGMQTSRVAIALGAFLVIIIAAIAIAAIVLLRKQEIDDWSKQSAAFSRMLAETTAQQMSTAFLALDSIVERIQDSSISDAAYLKTALKTPEFYQLLREKVAISPQIDVIGVVDDEGNIINYSREYPAPKRSVADRDYFTEQKNSYSLGTYVSRPLHNRSNGAWTFYITRRLTGSDGEFIGIVQLGVSPAFYSAFYERVSLRGQAAISLIRNDFTLLARWPAQDALMGIRDTGSAAYQVAQVQQKKSDVIIRDSAAESGSKAVQVMEAVQVVDKYPLIVSFSIDDELYLSDWRRTSLLIAMVASGTIIAVIVAFGMLASMFKRREEDLKITTALKQQAEDINKSQNALLQYLTEQQRALKDSSDRMEAIFQNAADGIIMIDEEGNIEAFNRAAQVIYGYKDAEVVGHHSRMFSPPGKYDLLELAMSRNEFVHTGQIHLEDEPVRNGGELFPAELSISEYYLSGKRKLIVIVRDITERRKMERIKSEFISTVSHELRTPLTAIRGSLGLVLGGAAGYLSDKAKPLISIAYKNSESLTRLINDLLDIQKIEAGKMDFKYELLPLQPLLESSVSDNQSFAQNLGVRIVLLDEDVADAIIRVDAGRFQQVMANLLSNACKYSPHGSEVTVLASRRESARIRVEVIDRGEGIPEKFRHRIFQKFSQADSSDTRAKGGTGLGLSITQAIVNQMQGEIGYYSQAIGAGQETHFFVEFPCWPAASELPEQASVELDQS
ncbi:ATP-binding protein [Undibacterium sp.]|uniref:ATP-binding protein n=1 Tax=Undibacterium sp. TaxID=1914977 RepID=UPI00374CEA29